MCTFGDGFPCFYHSTAANIVCYPDLLQQQQQHSQLVSHRKFSFDSNGNANIYQRSAKDYLPHISDRLSDHRLIAKQTAKKTFKVFYCD